MHNAIAKRIGIAKDSNGILRSNGFLIYWFIVRWVYKRKREDGTMNIRNTLCQQVIDSISKEPFSRCLQSFLSICQTLLLRKLVKPGYKRNSLFACFGSNLHHSRLPFQVFNLGILFAIKPPLSGFQLDLYFFFFIIFYGLNCLFRFSP